MSAVVEFISDAVESVVDAVGDAVESVVDVVSDAVEWVGETVEAVLEDPLPVLLSVAGSFIGIPPMVTNGLITAARGGDLGDIALSVGTAYFAPTVTNSISSTLSSAIGDSIINETVSNVVVDGISKGLVSGTISEIRGGDFEDGFAGGFTGTVVNAGVTELNNFVSDSVLTDLPDLGAFGDIASKAVTSGITAEVTGRGDFDDAFTNSFVNSAANVGATYITNSISNQFTQTEQTYDEISGADSGNVVDQEEIKTELADAWSSGDVDMVNTLIASNGLNQDDVQNLFDLNNDDLINLASSGVVFNEVEDTSENVTSVDDNVVYGTGAGIPDNLVDEVAVSDIGEDTTSIFDDTSVVDNVVDTSDDVFTSTADDVVNDTVTDVVDDTATNTFADTASDDTLATNLINSTLTDDSDISLSTDDLINDTLTADLDTFTAPADDLETIISDVSAEDVTDLFDDYVGSTDTVDDTLFTDLVGFDDLVGSDDLTGLNDAEEVVVADDETDLDSVSDLVSAYTPAEDFEITSVDDLADDTSDEVLLTTGLPSVYEDDSSLASTDYETDDDQEVLLSSTVPDFDEEEIEVVDDGLGGLSIVSAAQTPSEDEGAFDEEQVIRPEELFDDVTGNLVTTVTDDAENTTDIFGRPISGLQTGLTQDTSGAGRSIVTGALNQILKPALRQGLTKTMKRKLVRPTVAKPKPKRPTPVKAPPRKLSATQLAALQNRPRVPIVNPAAPPQAKKPVAQKVDVTKLSPLEDITSLSALLAGGKG